MDSGEIVVSSIRAGMKREFAMMMKAQSEIGALPAGRRRMTRSQSTAGSSKGNVRSADKVSRKVKGSNVGDDLGGLEADFVVVQRREAEKVGAELREDMPRVRGTDGDSIQEAERPVGETTDLGMKMSEKVELNRIPTKLKDLLQTGLLEGLHVRYIHGSKGRSRPESELVELFRELAYYVLVMNARKKESLESVILNAIGRSNYTTAFCINCKELIPETGAGRSMLLCDSCVLAKESDAGDAQIIDASHSACSSHIHWNAHLCTVSMAGPSAPASSSRPPVVSESAQISSHSQPQAKRQGKLTRKDLRMHKSVLAEDVLPEGTALSYVVRGEVSPSQFEAHAGYASRRKPYMSIYTSNGVSLHQLSLELSKIRRSSTEEHDDLCSICEDEEICYAVQTVHEAFTLNASVSQLFPKGYGTANIAKTCSKRKSLLSQMQMLLLLEESLVLYLLYFFLSLLCFLCEKEYHVGCLKEHNIEGVARRDWFCCTPCKNINSALQKLIGDGEQRLPEALSDVVKMKSEGQDLHKNPELGIRWRLLHGKKATEDSREALQRPGFCGMYCAVLMVGSVVVSAAIFRIFGEEVAELPLVATRSECQGKGYFQSLFYCVEGLLASLNVKDLVLPAADEAESLWKTDLGFKHSARNRLLNAYLLLYVHFTAAISV
ncbi:UNVERIFIED_CONTAM: hypothetical protein Sradi_7289900 [Sesamum radiatum]|uniref:N-acetyltransferase domain-containing protein n=1 Tax=Sesamum radiatum TaxID=300843 RepID=A0AAW2IIZ2_SESRA